MKEGPVYILDFKKTFDKYFHTLVLFARRFRLEEADCESIVQDSFVALWEHRNEFSDFLSVRAYLYTTVRGKALNILRRHKTETEYLSVQLLGDHSEKGCMEAVIEEETRRLLFNAIYDLPEQARKILLLNLEGKNNQEIAELLHITVDTIKFHKKNAYKILRSRLKEHFYLALPLFGIVFTKN